MRATVILVLASIVSTTCIADEQRESVKFEFGATLNAELSDTIDARKTKLGDPVRGRASEDMKAGGLIVIPRGARLIGRVTEARAAPRSDGAARLGIEFDRAELKDGRQIPLHATFFALAAPAGALTDHGSSSGGGFGGGSSVGEMMNASSHTPADEQSLKPSPGAIGGLDGNGLFYASSRGVFGLEDMSLEPGTTASAGCSVVLANARTVRLPSGTRMLLSVGSAGTR